MATSMTGYGRGEVSGGDRRVSVEIKSINNRYCDLQIRMPRALAALENRVREEITRQVARGKVDVYINFEDSSAASGRVSCDAGLAKAYAAALREIAETVGIPDGLNAAVIGRYSDVLQVQAPRLEPEEAWQMLREALQSALAALCGMRRLEGDRLARDMRSRSDMLKTVRLEIAERAPLVAGDYRARLAARIDELLGDRAAELFDEQRLAAEVAIFADKCAIDEELVRMESHLLQLDDLITLDEPIGKKLDFLVQEINREINTIGSKANDLELTRRVVILKSELEKIREQIQNLE